jgi:hypothetical protein
MSEPLHRHEREALAFLARQDGDTPGFVGTEDQLAAWTVFMDLEKRGLVMSVVPGEMMKFYVTEAGRAALEEAE